MWRGRAEALEEGLHGRRSRSPACRPGRRATPRRGARRPRRARDRRPRTRRSTTPAREETRAVAREGYGLPARRHADAGPARDLTARRGPHPGRRTRLGALARIERARARAPHPRTARVLVGERRRGWRRSLGRSVRGGRLEGGRRWRDGGGRRHLRRGAPGEGGRHDQVYEALQQVSGVHGILCVVSCSQRSSACITSNPSRISTRAALVRLLARGYPGGLWPAPALCHHGCGHEARAGRRDPLDLPPRATARGRRHGLGVGGLSRGDWRPGRRQVHGRGTGGRGGSSPLPARGAVARGHPQSARRLRARLRGGGRDTLHRHVDLLDGEDLGARLRRVGRLPLPDASRLLRRSREGCAPRTP